VAHPWKEDKCINCYHQHRPPRPDSVTKRVTTNLSHETSSPQPTSLYSRSTWRRPDTVQIKIMTSNENNPASHSYDNLNRQMLISAERGKHDRLSKAPNEATSLPSSPLSPRPLPSIPSKLRGGTTPAPMKAVSSPALLQPDQRNTVHMGSIKPENRETSPKPAKKINKHRIQTQNSHRTFRNGKILRETTQRPYQ